MGVLTQPADQACNPLVELVFCVGARFSQGHGRADPPGRLYRPEAPKEDEEEAQGALLGRDLRRRQALLPVGHPAWALPQARGLQSRALHLGHQDAAADVAAGAPLRALRPLRGQHAARDSASVAKV
eukprot:365339-Chlamydomonas_euryale.AAC.4